MEGERSGAPVGLHELFGYGGRGILGGYSGMMGAPFFWSHVDRMLILGVCWCQCGARILVAISENITLLCYVGGLSFFFCGFQFDNNCFPVSLEPLW